MYNQDYVIGAINRTISCLVEIEKDINANGVKGNLNNLKELGLVTSEIIKINKNNKNKTNMKTTVVKKQVQEVQIGKIRKISISEIDGSKSEKSKIDSSILELKQGECRTFSKPNFKKLRSSVYSYLNLIKKKSDFKNREYITRTEYDDSKKPTGVLIYRKK